uniref:Uncharacterized protein n=1 Tax=Brassica oleracea var. oleracea TaxID=109376 RepID=A0A0D3E876_BRAOL
MRPHGRLALPPSRSPRATGMRLPASFPTRSPRTTGVASLAVATGDRRRLPRGRHGRPACVSLTVATGDLRRLPRGRLPRGRHRRPAHVFLAVATGDRRRLLRENPGPQGKLWFPNFPLITEINGANFDSHSLALEGGGLRITLTHSHKTLDQNDVWKYERQNRSCNNAGKTTPAATSPIANTYANTEVLEKNRKPSHEFSPQEVLRNELAISLSKHKVKG